MQPQHIIGKLKARVFYPLVVVGVAAAYYLPSPAVFRLVNFHALHTIVLYLLFAAVCCSAPLNTLCDRSKHVSIHPKTTYMHLRLHLHSSMLCIIIIIIIIFRMTLHKINRNSV